MISIDTRLHDEAKGQFADLHHKRRLMTQRQSGAISAGRLYGYVMGKADDEVEAALGQDLFVRRVYRTMLQQSALVYIPQALAASTEDYPERHADGCRIRLQASRAESDQLYLIVEMSDQRRSMPTSLNLVGADETTARVLLPGARNGVMQTIIDKNSEAAQLLADPKTEIFLR